MATSSALEMVLAKDLSRTRGGVHLYAQHLREAGLLPRGGVGTGAPNLSEQHAANLLIALVAAPTAAKAPDTVKRLRAAPRVPAACEVAMRRDRSVCGELSLASAQTAGDALDALLRDMRRGRFDAWARDRDCMLRVQFVDDGAGIDFIVGAFGKMRLPRELEIVWNSIVIPFGNDDDERLVTRSIMLDGRVLQRLAAALDLDAGVKPPD